MKRNRATIFAEGSQYVEMDGVEYEVEWSATADMNYDPGRVTGPPEDCYPPESECDITEYGVCKVTGEDGEIKDPAIVSKCKAALDMKQVEDRLWIEFEERER